MPDPSVPIQSTDFWMSNCHLKSSKPIDQVRSAVGRIELEVFFFVGESTNPSLV